MQSVSDVVNPCGNVCSYHAFYAHMPKWLDTIKEERKMMGAR